MLSFTELAAFFFPTLAELFKRFLSRNWETTTANVCAFKVRPVSGPVRPMVVLIAYVYYVQGEIYNSGLERRCLLARSVRALREESLAPGLLVRFNPDRPDRSYLPLKLGPGGLIFSTLAVVPMLCILAWLVIGILQSIAASGR